jgi:hypothetical protein
VQEAPVLSAKMVESTGLILELGNEERGKALLVLSPDLHLGCPSPKSQLTGSDQLLHWASKFSHDRSRGPSRRRNWLSRADCPSAAQSAGRLRGRIRLPHRPQESSQSGVLGIDDNEDPSVSRLTARPIAVPARRWPAGGTQPPDRTSNRERADA